MATAAASCWEIKRLDPATPDGVYWLWTPRLGAPQQFYCEMDSGGGGWVLIGRGREGWQSSYNGAGDPSELLVTRTDFTTTQLPAATVDGLLAGRRVSESGAVRVRRAMDPTGTRWQEVRMRLADRDRWVWTLGAGHRLRDYSFRSSTTALTASGGRTNSFGSGARYERMDTKTVAAQRHTQGFAYGYRVLGSNDPSSYLWSAVDGLGKARPYAEVYLRPRLRMGDFPAIPDGGTNKSEQAPVASTWGARQQWGVTGLGHDYPGDGNVHVQAFAQVGSRIYVGGNFTTVQRGRYAAAADQVRQPFLAAFSSSTGEFDPSFRPDLDGEVRALAVLPDSRLAVGGEFRNVDGAGVTGLVALDSVTGALDAGFRTELAERRSSRRLQIRDLDVAGEQLYVAGSFSHVRGLETAPFETVSNAVRLSAMTGAPDSAWTPRLDGTVLSVDADPAGQRVYLAGHFTSSNGTPANKVAAVQTVAGAPLVKSPWSPTWSDATHNYQYAVAVDGSRVWAGGAQHSLFSFSTSNFERLSANLSGPAGGDFQTLAVGDEVVYGGCHCSAFNYQDAAVYPPWRSPTWTQADSIGWVGAYTSDGKYIPQFSPTLRSPSGAGVWASHVDSAGSLWVGGDLTAVQTGQTTSAWVGGFARFPMQDHQAPETPTIVDSRIDGDTASLSWTGSTDDRGPVTYEVLRDNKVVALIDAATAATVPAGGANRFFVRAADGNGNRSASSPVTDL